MRRLLLFALMGLAVAGVSACATARAETPIVMQPLDVPPVPPRVIVPDIEEIVPAVDDPAAAKTGAARPDAAAKPPERTAEPPRTGQAETPPTAETPPRVRTPQTANDEQADRDVRSIMARAQGLLNNVDYRALSHPARQQYDTAKRFIKQAENALRIRNYVFARNLADKAETLARQLGK